MYVHTSILVCIFYPKLKFLCKAVVSGFTLTDYINCFHGVGYFVQYCLEDYTKVCHLVNSYLSHLFPV